MKKLFNIINMRFVYLTHEGAFKVMELGIFDYKRYQTLYNIRIQRLWSDKDFLASSQVSKVLKKIVSPTYE